MVVLRTSYTVPGTRYMLHGSGDDVPMTLPHYLALGGNVSPERHRPPRSRATAPRPPNTATQGVIGERSGANAELGERGAWKGTPGDGLDRSPLRQGIIKTWKSRYGRGIFAVTGGLKKRDDDQS